MCFSLWSMIFVPDTKMTSHAILPSLTPEWSDGTHDTPCHHMSKVPAA